MFGSRGPNACVRAMRTLPFFSVGYGFTSAKRNVHEAQVAKEECEQPNAVGFDDGSRLNLTAMDEGLVGEIMEYLDQNITGIVDLPEMFQEYQT